MGEKNKEVTSEKPQPKIIGTEEKKILDKRPPNDKIINFNIYEKDSKEEE